MPAALADRRGLVVAPEQQVPERPQHAALRLEGDVHRLQRDAGLGGDRRHGGGCVALPLEQSLGRGEDVAARRRRLLPPPRRVVAPCGLDRFRHFDILPTTSLHVTCNESLRGITMNTSTTTDPRRAHLHGMWAAVADSWR